MNTSSTTAAHRPHRLSPSERVRQRARERQHARATGEATPTPGLGVVPTLRPHLGGWQFTGEWSVNHTLSGLKVLAVDGAGLGHARDLAAVLADTGIDWTHGRDEIIHRPHVKALLVDLRRRADFAIWHARPLRLRPSSWNPLPPSWFLHDTRPDADPDDELFGSYADAVYVVVTAELDGFEVRQGTEQEWELRCAWTGCQAGVIGEDDLFLRDPDRGQLRAAADDERWRPLDDHRWLCPDCSYQFTPTTPATPV